jgi:hypothetical protein
MGDRTLCKFKGSKLAKDPEAQRSLILDPAYICEKCGRVAHSDRNLCHSTPLAAPDGDSPDRRQRGKKEGKKRGKKGGGKDAGKEARKKDRKQDRKRDGKKKGKKK